MLWIGLIVVVVLIAAFVAVRERRKGDFAFRIRKLERRATALVSSVMQLQGEADYLALYAGTPKETLSKRFDRMLKEANDVAVGVAERLKELDKRAHSLTDFSDMYVDIGEAEERLEQGEAKLAELRALYAQLDPSSARA